MVPAGLGDILWVYQKLNAQPFDLHFVIAPDGRLKRGLNFCKLLPRVTSAEYGSAVLWEKVVGAGDMPRRFADIPDDGTPQVFSANKHLELGYRLETLCPDLPTDFFPDLDIGDEARARAAELLPAGPRYVAVYCSACETIRRWEGWTVYEWAEFCAWLTRAFPNAMPVLVGSWWDKDMNEGVTHLFENLRLPHINLCAKTDCRLLAAVLERCCFNIGLASGVNILATAMKIPTVMLYPPHLGPLSTAWPPLDMLKDGLHQAYVFGRPTNIIRRIHPLIDWCCNSGDERWVRDA